MSGKNLDTLVILLIVVVCTFIPLKNLYQKLTEVHTAPKEEIVSPTPAPASGTPDVNLCPDEPEQENVYDSDAHTFSLKGYKIHELAHFQIKGILLSRHFYNSDSQQYRSVLSPGDFALGWGPMSNPTVLTKFTYFQKNRFLYFACYDSFSHEAERLGADFHLANIHLIPANDLIANTLSSIKPRDIVTLKGSLVEVFYNDQRVWKSSMTNNVTGDGACKVLFLKDIEWNSGPESTKDVPLPHEPEQQDSHGQSLPKSMGT
jgi:hypothetical protein